MALFVRQDQQRSQLQQKLAADLKHKLVSSKSEAADTSPAILDNEHQTRPAGVVITVLVLVAMVVGAIVLFINK